MPDPAAAGAKCVTIYTDENTRPKLIAKYTIKPATYDFWIRANVNENFQPAKFSTAILMKTAANPVPEHSQENSLTWHDNKNNQMLPAVE